MKRSKSKSSKKARIFQSHEKDGHYLHTDENNFEGILKPFDFMFVFLAFYTFYWLKSLKHFLKSK